RNRHERHRPLPVQRPGQAACRAAHVQVSSVQRPDSRRDGPGPAEVDRGTWQRARQTAACPANWRELRWTRRCRRGHGGYRSGLSASGRRLERPHPVRRRRRRHPRESLRALALFSSQRAAPCAPETWRPVALVRKMMENLPVRLPGARLVLRIVNYPHPALRYPSRPVTQIDEDLRATVQQMFSLMYTAKGVGLAANQVALPYRFFILNITADLEQKDQELVFINPQIVKRHSSIEDEEGCLSLPGLYSKVRRARKIKVQAFNLQGELFECEAEDLFSRVIQHEADHLDGPLARHALKPKLQDFENQFRQAQASGEYPLDREIITQLDNITSLPVPVPVPLPMPAPAAQAVEG